MKNPTSIRSFKEMGERFFKFVKGIFKVWYDIIRNVCSSLCVFRKVINFWQWKVYKFDERSNIWW
ncbi:hypothetical protein MtrunA17_Chr8g0367231 [Medicago truncatula]|uniref:Uncharacterized protein n=1 Tax=Medicago truncatula TaxID=3880 RepID=I3SIT4_MEDTR|nr:unknown [Medicago truncatula]RHN41548.1 hypothetical protein MtrunA17_Chr8g0367231 [Medicago truncatula]